MEAERSMAGEIWMLVSMDMEEEGGPRSHIRELCLNFARLGYRVTLFAPGYGGTTNASHAIPGVTVRYVPVGAKGLASAARYEVRLARTVCSLLRETSPAFIYAREVPAGCWIAPAARQRGVPYWIEKNGMVGSEAAGRPVSRLYRTAVHASERLAVRHCDGIVAVSGGIREGLLREYHIAPERVVVIPNGADGDLFVPVADRAAERVALGLPQDRQILVFAGTLASWQRVDVMVDAMACLERQDPGRCLLVIVGDGDERSALEQQVRRLGLQDAVRFLGWVPYEDVHRYMGAADAALVLRDPSLAGIATFSPLKLFEYAFTGTPVIYSSSALDPALAGEASLLGRELTALQPEALAELVRAFLPAAGQTREQLLAARPALLERHSWQAVAAAVARRILEET